MPIFKASNVIFIHIPKTAGSSIEKQLYKLEQPIDQYSSESLYWHPNSGLPIPKPYSPQHLTYIDLKKHLRESIKQYKYIFTVVRNPYERLVSEFYWYYSCNQMILPNKNDLPTVFEKFCEDLFHGNITNDGHERPQITYIINEHGQIDPKIKILHYESLGKDFLKLFGFPLMEHILKSNEKATIKEIYNKNSKKLAKSYYKKDFEYLGYST